MKHFDELNTIQKNFINGKISQFTDAYIRKFKVWTPNQILFDFNEKIQQNIAENHYLTNEKYKKYLTEKNIKDEELRLEAINWLITQNGNEYALCKFTEKYEKNTCIAEKFSPLVERVRFGHNWDPENFFDINFGLKAGFQYIEIEKLQNIEYKPWTVEHLNRQLAENYNTNLSKCLKRLSTSHLEKKFVDYWIDKFNKPENPALIPEVCGLRKKFYYHRYNNRVYASKSEILDTIKRPVENVNFRFDFLVANFTKQKLAFIELDGYEYHKTKEQQAIDSIKRNTSSNLDIPIFTFTSNKIYENIDAVFQQLELYLT